MLMCQKGFSKLDKSKVGVVAPDEILAVLLRSLMWVSEQKMIMKEQTDAESGKVFHDSIKQNGSYTLSSIYQLTK